MLPAQSSNHLTPCVSRQFLLPEVPPHQSKGTHLQIWKKSNKKVFLKGLCLNFHVLKMIAKRLFAWFCEFCQNEATCVVKCTSHKQARISKMREETSEKRARYRFTFTYRRSPQPRQRHGASQKCLLDCDNRRNTGSPSRGFEPQRYASLSPISY